MIEVRSVTYNRGFLKDLFEYNAEDIKFYYSTGKMYERNSKKKLMLSSLVKLPIFDYLGLFNVPKVKIEEEVAFSYNRFLFSNKPYVLYLENPIGPVHYCIGRPKTYISKIRLNRIFRNKNLKKIVCLSKVCRDTLYKFYDIPEDIDVTNIYPLVKQKTDVHRIDVSKKSYMKELTLLYISSSFELKGGQDILQALKKINDAFLKLIIVTQISTISKKDLEFIHKQKNIELLEFNLSKEMMGRLYFKANILLNPSRQDSFPLVILEAMKYGDVILSTNLYAIPEMIEEGVEGFLTRPKYEIWNSENMPNKKVWNHRRNTIYSSYVDNDIVQFLVEKITLLKSNRNLLETMGTNALVKATTGEFSNEFIFNEWKNMFENARKD